MAYVTVDVGIDEFYDEDLIDELEKRGYTISYYHDTNSIKKNRKTRLCIN